jgi:hypothetical protein
VEQEEATGIMVFWISPTSGRFLRCSYSILFYAEYFVGTKQLKMNKLTREQLIKKNKELKKELALNNRELEIEAALERIRSRSMAMHKSDELMEVIQLVYEQLVRLNFKINSANLLPEL